MLTFLTFVLFLVSFEGIQILQYMTSMSEQRLFFKMRFIRDFVPSSFRWIRRQQILHSRHAIVIFLITFADAAFTFLSLPSCSLLVEQYHLFEYSSRQKVHFNYILQAALSNKRRKALAERGERKEMIRILREEKDPRGDKRMCFLAIYRMIFLWQSNNWLDREKSYFIALFKLC